jgi:hypothetical protein
MLTARHLRDLTLSGKPGFLAAASGLVVVGDRFHVVADDALHLASFDLNNSEQGSLFRLRKGRLPAEHAARKAQKPDFETLIRLPGTEPMLLALGSGSRPNRCGGFMIVLGQDSMPTSKHLVDLTPLYDPLGHHFAETNIEGAVATKDRLLLFQRASAASPINAVIAYPLQAALDAVKGQGAAPPPEITKVQFPEVDGALLSFTDATLLENGIILFSAVAEASANAYDDGPLRSAAIGLLDQDFNLSRIEMLSPTIKVEGIAAIHAGEAIDILMVTDADDPAKAAGLWTAQLR